MGLEFRYIEKFTKDGNGVSYKGVDIGCGTSRLSDDILAIDQQPDKRYANADIVHDCKDLEIKLKEPFEFKGNVFQFKNNELDFVFSSHCLEDFENIPEVFLNWWRKIRVDGFMILLLPDMETCDCSLCNSDAEKERRKKMCSSARYWTIEDYSLTRKGNPSHRTNVGKKYIHSVLAKLKKSDGIDYKIVQEDTIEHNKSCSIDFVIQKRR